jgi:hypothetical protein
MELREGLKIQIERVTDKGTLKSLCTYFESNGSQYGMIKEKRKYYAIHLDTGFSEAEIDRQGTNESTAFEFLKAETMKIKPADLKKGVAKILNVLQEKGLTYPVN